MAESDSEPLWQRSGVHCALAWLRAPSEQEDHASFQLDVVWFDAVERLPEVFALELSNPSFEVAWNLLHTALTFPLNVFVATPAPNPMRPDGKVTVHNVMVGTPSGHVKREEFRG